MYTPVNPSFTKKVGCKGVFVTRTCFRDVTFVKMKHFYKQMFKAISEQLSHIQKVKSKAPPKYSPRRKIHNNSEELSVQECILLTLMKLNVTRQFKT